MNILMVSPYPPARDGIAGVAVQEVAQLRGEGHRVEVLSPGPSAAHHHLDLRGVRGCLALARRVRRYDRVIVQFHPDTFFPVGCAAGERARISLALAGVFRAARDLEVRVHETDYSLGAGHGPVAVATRAMWHAAPRLVAHTEVERDSFHRAFGVSMDRIAVAIHGAGLMRRVAADQGAARDRLGIPPDTLMFLAIGFIQPHKGFDRAVRAFAGLGARGSRLDIVGSVRVEEPDYVRHLTELEELVARTPGTHLHVGYVSDEAFDRWLVAADVIVLPYRYIWSSAVMERAALYGRPVIATRVGGLQSQARPDTTVVTDDAELAAALWRVVEDRAPAITAPELAPWPEGAELTATAVQAAVVSRAATARGGPAPPHVENRAAGVGRAGEPATGLGGGVATPLRRLPLLAPPAPTSARTGAGLLKRLVRRLTAWEIDPIVGQLNHLHAATTEAAERLARAGDETPVRSVE